MLVVQEAHEAIAFIEDARVVVNGIHDDAQCGDLARDTQTPRQRIEEQAWADTGATVSDIAS